MSAFVSCSYTPPPPSSQGKSGSTLSNTTSASTTTTSTTTTRRPSIPLPPVSKHGSTVATSSPQIRYCYFISAASASTSRSRNPSLSRKPVYLSPPHDADATAPGPQPRTRPTNKDAPSPFVLGPSPPQIQLQFLEDEPLPPPSTYPSSDPSDLTSQDTSLRLTSEVLVERKDSGYGGSVSRSSSLAAFGRGIRKVFWRTSAKGSVESVIVSEAPILDCDIPQDVLDHEGWAQDLAQRLSLASGPDVSTWLGQLSSETMIEDFTALDELPSPDALALAAAMDNSFSTLSVHNLIEEEELVFNIPFLPVVVPPTPPPPPKTDDVPSPFPERPTSPVERPSTPVQSLRHSFSMEALNKPQPPLPKSVTAPSPKRTKETGTSSLTSLSSLARKMTVVDLSFLKGSKGSQERPRLQDLFQERDQKRPIHSVESLVDEPSELMMSPEELEAPSYLQAKSPKRSTNFFKSLSGFSDENKARVNEERPPSEVLLSDSNLSPEEFSREIALASRSSSLRSPTMRKRIPVWRQDATNNTTTSNDKGSDLALAPPEPLFYNKGVSSSTSSLAESSTCGSLDSFAIDSSADEWEGLGRLGRQNKEQDSRYSTDLRELQSLLFSAQAGSTARPQSYYAHSANTSTGSLTASVPSLSSSPSRQDSKPKPAKKEDYMSHRMSGLSPKLQPKLLLHGKIKPRSKSRLSMTYGGGELEVVRQAKFDTPEAIARNKEIRKFISQEIYTTELNYLQFLKTIQEVFVDPLERSLETEKPFIPRSNALFQLLAHVSELIEVSSQVVKCLEDCVRDEVWSDTDSLVGMIFLDVKEPLSIFLMYGQSYVKGMKALRTLLKSKRATTSVYIPTMSPAAPATVSTGGPRMDKRRSLPSVFSLNMTPNMPTSPLDGTSTNSSCSGDTVESKRMNSKPRSSHGTLQITRESTEYDRFIHNCIGGKETTSRFSLADLLILPIQRVTRYCLLLKDLKRHTDVEHADYVGLVHALEQLHTLATATNDAQPWPLRS
ncbi:Rho guanine nucleotide exchange factor (GEF) 17 [Mortierella antarctica]|nr:Rho guanine nucleotide exchange factor (GEF) 17 [Mortierella antarctica]